MMMMYVISGYIHVHTCVMRCCVVALQDFDIDLEGAQTLRILCYKKENESNTLIGKGAFEVYLQLFF